MSKGVPYRAGLYILLLPYLLGAVVLVAAPALLSFALSLTRYDGFSPTVYVGLQNFHDIRFEPLLWISLRNSLFFVVLAVPFRLLGALGLALLYNRLRPAVGIYRAVICLPTVIPDVAYALVWLWILNPLYGPLNMALRALGLPAPAWLVDYMWAKPALVLMSLFQIGEGFVILLAGLKNIPPVCYDAARVDGGSRWQIFRFITFPMLSPWLVLLSVRDTILSFQSTFTSAYIMTRGGPYYATFFTPLLIYEEAFDRFRFGQGAAIMLIVFAVTFLLVLLLYWLFEGWGFDEEN